MTKDNRLQKNHSHLAIITISLIVLVLGLGAYCCTTFDSIKCLYYVFMCKTFKQNDDNYKLDAVNKMSEMKDKRSLYQMTNDNDREVREYATLHLSYLGDERAIELLISMLNNSTDKYFAASALGNIALHGGEETRVKCKKAVNLLVGMLNDNSVTYFAGSRLALKIAAADALGKIGDKNAVKPLIEKMADSDNIFRLYVVRALDKLSDQCAIQPLKNALSKETDKEVKKAIIEALKNIEVKVPSDIE